LTKEYHRARARWDSGRIVAESTGASATGATGESRGLNSGKLTVCYLKMAH